MSKRGVVTMAGVDLNMRLDDDLVAFAEAVARGCTNVTREQVLAVWLVTHLLRLPPMAEPKAKPKPKAKAKKKASGEEAPAAE